MATSTDLERPYAHLGIDALVELARTAVATQNYIEATRVWEEARFRRKKNLTRVAAELEAGDVGPVTWLRKAEDIAQTFSRSTTGKHHVYVALLKADWATSRYGVYVGESRYIPAKRFAQHKAGIRAAGSVERNGVCLLPALYEHLNPLSKPEAKHIEGALAEAFKAAGIPTKGGH